MAVESGSVVLDMTGSLSQSALTTISWAPAGGLVFTPAQLGHRRTPGGRTGPTSSKKARGHAKIRREGWIRGARGVTRDFPPPGWPLPGGPRALRQPPDQRTDFLGAGCLRRSSTPAVCTQWLVWLCV